MPVLFDIIVAHIIGDYFLQNNYLALTKNIKNAEGFMACVAHCTIYALTYAIIVAPDFEFIFTVFMGHYIMDRYSLGEKYLRAVGGRSVNEFLEIEQPMDRFTALQAAFTAIVYVIVDNTMHLLITIYFYQKLVGAIT